MRHVTTSFEFRTRLMYIRKFRKKFKCEMLAECVAYTFEQARLSCILHSSVDKGQRYTRGKQTGMKKPDYILSIPEVSFCSEKNRKRRCRREPKCQNVNCLRNAQDCFLTRLYSAYAAYGVHSMIRIKFQSRINC